MLRKRIVVVLTVVLMMLSVYTSVGLGYARTGSLNRDVTMSALGLKGQINVQSLPTLGGPDMPASVPFSTQGTGLLDRTGGQASLPDSAASQNVAIQGVFSGLTLSDNVAVTGFLVTPPDVAMAVGPSNTFEMVNIVGAIFSKGGARETTFSLASFFNAGNDFLSDPKVLFDASSGRWFASVIDENTLSVSIAVSESSDAAGSFCLFSIPSAPNFPDQPIIGVSNDKLVVSINLFSSHSFLGAQFFVLNKSQLTACSTSVDIFTSAPDRTVFSVHPVQSLTSTTTEFMVSTLSRSGGLVFLYSVNGVPPGPVTVSRTALTVSAIDSPPQAVQLGSTLKLDTGDFRVQDAFWSNNALWLAHANACVPSGDTAIRSCIHLVELNTLTSSVVQDFNFGSSGSYLLYPALRPDARGNLLVIYGFSSASDFPGLKVTEQATTDAPNTLETPLLLQAGFGPVELTFGCSVTRGCRYGDYFSAAVDPSSPNVVWVAGEFGSGVTFGKFGGGWATELGTVTG